MAKKVLFISSYAPPIISGGPKIMYGLLKSLPRNSYNILTSFFAIDNVSAKMGDWLPGGYIFYDHPQANRKTFNLGSVQGKAEKTRSFITKLKHLAKRVWFIRSIIGIPVICLQIILIVRQGKKSVVSGDVDMLFGFPDYGPAMIGTYLIHRATGKPYSVCMFDLYKDNNFPFPGGILANLFEPKIFRSATKIMLNNAGTLDYYKECYPKEVTDKMVIIPHSISPKPYVNLQTPYKPKPPYTILFTGGIYWPQIASIKNLIRAVEAMDDLDIKFQIYCPNPKDYLARVGIRESSRLSIKVASPQEIPHIQSKADILFLPFAWRAKSEQIVNTATPGKMIDYLIAGRPILIHAPSSAYLVKYAKENNFAAVVDRESIPLLQNTIRRLLTDLPWARQLISNAQSTFYQNHNLEKNIKLFQALLT